MSRLFNAAVLTVLFIVHNAWAVCESDIDMQGKRVLDVAVLDEDGRETVSEAATLAYLKEVMDQRSRGNELSHMTRAGLTWAEAHSFCATLVSPAVPNPGEESAASQLRLYNDWRLPALNEWLASCHAQGSRAKLDLAGKRGRWYKEERIHPERKWYPAGVCHSPDDTDSLWWINSHTTETQEGEDLLYHGALPTDIRDARTTHIDPLHHIYAPEPEGVVRNIVYGYPEAWNPTSAAIRKVSGDQKHSVRCVR